LFEVCCSRLLTTVYGIYWYGLKERGCDAARQEMTATESQ
jgi:hypothetical protein